MAFSTCSLHILATQSRRIFAFSIDFYGGELLADGLSPYGIFI